MADARKEQDHTFETHIRDLGPWFHNLTIGGIQTAPDHFLGDYPNFKWQGFRQVVPEDLSGCSVLDVGSVPKLNHHTSVTGGVLAEPCGELLRRFFRERRAKESIA